MTLVMDEQRMDSMKDGEKLDDLRHIISERDEMIHDQLAELMDQTKMARIDDACDIVRRDDDKSKVATVIDLLKKDVGDGQPPARAEELSNGDGINTRQETVRLLPTYIPDKGADAELDNLISKWTRAKIDDQPWWYQIKRP